MGNRNIHEQAVDYPWIFTFFSPTAIDSSVEKFLAFTHDEVFIVVFFFQLHRIWLQY